MPDAISIRPYLKETAVPALNLPVSSQPKAMIGRGSQPAVFGEQSASLQQAIPRRLSPMRIAVFGNHLPRQCGIATFTTDLCDAIAAEYGESDLVVVAVNDAQSSYAYPPSVRFVITEGKLSSYEAAAKFLIC